MDFTSATSSDRDSPSGDDARPVRDDTHHVDVVVMGPVATPPAKAFIAPENYEEPIRFSGHVERPGGDLEFSPVFSSLDDAVAWARERTDVVIARDVSGGYRWYGDGPPPPDLETAPA